MTEILFYINYHFKFTNAVIHITVQTYSTVVYNSLMKN